MLLKRARNGFSALLLAPLLLAPACVTPETATDPGSTGDPADPSADDGTPGEDGDDSGTPGDGSTVQLASIYTMEISSSVTVKDKTSGEVQTLRTNAGSLVTVTQSGSDVQMSVQMCYAIPPEINGEQPVIPDSVIASVAPFDVQGLLVGSRLVTDPAALVLGAQLSNPMSDALPTSPGDARVFDQDSDGNPGITIDYPSAIGVIEIYAAAKFTFSVSADVSNPESFEGTSEAALITEVLDDNSFFVDVRSMAEEAEDSYEVQSEDHRVSLTASSATSCASAF